MEFGQPRAAVEQRNVLSWQDANLTFVRPAWDDICRQRRDRSVESRHDLELTASVRVRAGVRVRPLGFDTQGTGNSHPGWRYFETHSEHVALPVIIACPAENLTVAHDGAYRARERIDVE
jgi:hypothetical protein